jgi:hypothetical protein
MSLEESQAWSWEESGWVSRSVPVRFLYTFIASLKIDWKSDDKEVR